MAAGLAERGPKREPPGESCGRDDNSAGEGAQTGPPRPSEPDDEDSRAGDPGERAVFAGEAEKKPERERRETRRRRYTARGFVEADRAQKRQGQEDQGKVVGEQQAEPRPEKSGDKDAAGNEPPQVQFLWNPRGPSRDDDEQPGPEKTGARRRNDHRGDESSSADAERRLEKPEVDGKERRPARDRAVLVKETVAEAANQRDGTLPVDPSVGAQADPVAQRGETDPAGRERASRRQQQARAISEIHRADRSRQGGSLKRRPWTIEWLDGGAKSVSDRVKAWWDRAFEAHGSIWNCRAIAECWEETFLERRGLSPALCRARRGEGEEVLYPLYARRDPRIAGRWLVEPIGGLDLCDYQDPLSEAVPDGEYWSAVSAAVRKRFGVLSELRAYRLSRPPTDRRPRRIDFAPRISLSTRKGIEDFLETRSPKLRKYVLRRLRQLPELRVRRVGASDLAASLDLFFRRYLAEWEKPGKSRAPHDPAVRVWWESLARAALSAGKLHFSVLECGPDDWHWHLGFVHRGSLLWYKLAYNLTFEAYSPGMLHLALLIESARCEGVSEIDLGSGSEPYKLRWATESVPLYNISTGAASWANRIVQRFRGKR